MIGRRTAVGLSLLCALLFSAIAVQSASAAKAVNTTAFTCVKDSGSEDFKDPHCDEKVFPGTGDYGHVAIAKDQTTDIEGVQLSNAVFKSKAAGAAVEFTCTVVKSIGGLHNVETSGKHTVTGDLLTTFSNCTVNKPLKCILHEPIVTEATFEGVEKLGAGGNEMGVEYKPTGGGGVLFSVSFTDAPGGVQCNIEGTFPITGTKVATGKPAPTENHSGATSIFTDAMTTETMKFGPEKLGLSLETTMKMDPNENPITLTTVT